MVKVNGKSGGETTYPNEPETPSKFKKDLESSTTLSSDEMPDIWTDEMKEFIQNRTSSVDSGLKITILANVKSDRWNTLEKLHYHNIKTMKGFFYVEGCEPPLSISATDGDKVFCLYRDNSDDAPQIDTETFSDLVRKHLRKNDIQRYAVIMSGWYTEHKGNEEPTCRPSESPNRKECIFLYSEDINGKFCMSSWDIVTGEDGLRDLKLTQQFINKDIDPNEAGLRSKFMGLLKKKRGK